MPNLEEMIIEACKRDLRITGIFQVANVLDWKVNLRHPSGHYDYGYGATPTEAMADGLDRAKGLKGPENRSEAPIAAPVVKPKSLADLL